MVAVIRLIVEETDLRLNQSRGFIISHVEADDGIFGEQERDVARGGELNPTLEVVLWRIDKDR